MDDDDVIKGKVLSRREMLAIFGLGGAAAFLAACTGGETQESAPTAAAQSATTNVPETATTGGTGVTATATSLPSCIVIPELTEGPYFVDTMLERADIRSDPDTGEVMEGVPFALNIIVVAVSGASCTPLEGAMVDVWHCDALGAYSGFEDRAEGFSTVGERWLRGYQDTDGNGQASFTTIYPGWYRGRATHIHFKVRKDNMEFTSQWFFDDALSDQVHNTSAAYAAKGASGRLQNEQDNIYAQSDGMLMLDVQPSGDGYEATFAIGIQM